MARFAQVDHPAALAAATRPAIGGNPFSSVTAVGALLYLLAALGSLVFRAAAALRLAFAGWLERRRQREEDRKVWELALSDPRVMADLVAVRQHAPAKSSEYF